jgi:sulfatase maturation enzyme AslB (radical SAM superfamily)
VWEEGIRNFQECPSMPENCIYIARSSAIAARALAGEMMVMNSADSTFFTLNEVATAIFQAADGHTPLREIVRDRSAGNLTSIPNRPRPMPSSSSPSSPATEFFSFPINLWLRGAPSMSLMSEVGQKAFNLGVPLAVHMDVTYRCNERCVHCYLDHDDHGEMTTAEIKDVLDQLAEAGVFFLTFSGGEVFMRRDFFEIVEYARRLMFNVKIKTNAVMIHEEEARRIRELDVDTIQISVYSHRPEVHDAITKLPHSFERTIGPFASCASKACASPSPMC